MITVDLHTHTSYGHGASTAFEMFLKGKDKGLKIHGFSEHSVRPLGYNYTNEYRDHLEKSMPIYTKEVEELKKLYPCLPPNHAKNSVVQKSKNIEEPSQVLFGVELDWFENEIPFMQNIVNDYPYDYIIAGIHFIGSWGFDDKKEHWDILSENEKFHFYDAYYKTMIKMAQSGLFQIVAHPDLIKIFSVDSFHKWLPNNLSLVENALRTVKDANMVMEISSAGLRKVCAEIYPCRPIMEIAKRIEIPISFASDGHCVNSIATHFDTLEEYAKEYGYYESAYFIDKKIYFRKF